MRFTLGLLVHRTWMIAAVAIVACAGLGLRTVRTLEAADAGDEVALPPRVVPVPHAAARQSQVTLDPDVISARDIFCSSCTRSVTPASYRGHPAVLIATSVSPDPARSHATVRVTPTDVQGSWLVAQTIPGVGTITRIGGASIDVVDDAGHTKTMTLLEPVAAGHGTPGAATPGAGPAAARAASPFAGRIEALGEMTYAVDRALVRELFASGGKDTGVRAMPVLVRGEITGLRLLGVKSTSVAAALGLRSGDVLSSVDDEPIKTAQQLLDLYAKLDRLDAVELQGTRAGKPLAVSLRLR